MAGLTIEQIRAAYSRWLDNPDEDTTIGQLTAQAPNPMERLFAMYPAGGRLEGQHEDAPDDDRWRLSAAIREAKRQRLIQMRTVAPE